MQNSKTETLIHFSEGMNIIRRQTEKGAEFGVTVRQAESDADREKMTCRIPAGEDHLKIHPEAFARSMSLEAAAASAVAIIVAAQEASRTQELREREAQVKREKARAEFIEGWKTSARWKMQKALRAEDMGAAVAQAVKLAAAGDAEAIALLDDMYDKTVKETES